MYSGYVRQCFDGEIRIVDFAVFRHNLPDTLECGVGFETKQEISDLKTSLEEDQKTMESLQTEYEDTETELNTTIDVIEDQP